MVLLDFLLRHSAVKPFRAPRPSSPLRMPPALLLLVALQVSVLVDRTAGIHDPGTPQHRPEKTRFLVILPERRDRSSLVSIFDVRRRRFVCVDVEGQLSRSRQKDGAECLFQRVGLKLSNRLDVFYVTSSGRLLRLQGAGLQGAGLGAAGLGAAGRGPPASSAPLQGLLGRLARRRRRSEEVNPSDPLRSESHPSHPAKEHQDADQPEQDQAGAVSKETINSCDDPLRVLQSNGQVSPVKTNIVDRAQHD